MSMLPMLLMAATAQRRRQESYRRSVNRRREEERKARDRRESRYGSGSSSYHYRDEEGHIAYLIQNDEELSKFFDDLGTGIRFLRKAKIQKFEEQVENTKKSVLGEKGRLKEVTKLLEEKGFSTRCIYYLYKGDLSITEDLFSNSPNRIETSYEREFQDEIPEECQTKIDKSKIRLKKLKASKNPLFKQRREEEIKMLKEEIDVVQRKLDNYNMPYVVWKSLTPEDKELAKEFFSLVKELKKAGDKCSSLNYQIIQISDGNLDKEFMETTMKLFVKHGRFTKRQIGRAKSLVRGVIDEPEINSSEVISNDYYSFYDNKKGNRIKFRRIAIKNYLEVEKDSYNREKRNRNKNKTSERIY